MRWFEFTFREVSRARLLADLFTTESREARRRATARRLILSVTVGAVGSGSMHGSGNVLIGPRLPISSFSRSQPATRPPPCPPLLLLGPHSSQESQNLRQQLIGLGGGTERDDVYVIELGELTWYDLFPRLAFPFLY
jgi:hypothetical protein